MKIRNVCLCVAVLSAPAAQASIQLDNISCSGSLSLNDQNGVSFDCGGDLSLSRGTVSSETGNLLIKAGGTLSLENVLLIASNIRLTGSTIYIADDVNFDISSAAADVFSERPLLDISQGSRIEWESGTSLEVSYLSGGNVEASRSDRPALYSDAGVRLIGGNITTYEPKILTGLDVKIQINSGAIILAQGSPAIVPLPPAFFNAVLGLIFCFSSVLRGNPHSRNVRQLA